ncbi:phage tail protein [Algoriphagus chordae]|uniref:Microcystin-dependent protein n=1 Tax=Algoriphagus chordae TaxID=237019 RepID=A0A2W7R9B7_9BACT|nr:tail fiber protein [Algoriphagus chordae]PZX55696.1 microcystin-dependent protein [Algoriphagus chordae]
MEEMIGVIKLFAGNFAPRGWAFCEGQLLSVNVNQALFSILGTIYGGDGRTTFALPDLRGRVPIGAGSGPGLSPIRLGAKGGAESTTLQASNLPSHTHNLNVSSNPGSTNNPQGGFLAQSNVTIERGGAAVPTSSYTEAGHANMGTTNAIGSTGGSQLLPLLNPYEATSYIICMEGIYPSRS